MRFLTGFAIFVAMLAGGLPAGLHSARAQIPAFLPDKNTVEPGEPSAVDGTYTVSTIGKRITIDRGRAYVIDPWLHAMVLKVRPNMVVLRNFRRTGPDSYEADDLPLMGKARFVRRSDGSLDARVDGSLGPAQYRLIPTAYVGTPDVDPGDGTPPPAPPPPPSQPREREYRVHVSIVSCDGTALLRKNYYGRFLLSVVDGTGKKVSSKLRSHHVKCTKKGPRVKTFGFDAEGAGSLALVVPAGQDGFSDLVVEGEISDPLGVVPFYNKKSSLLLKAHNLRREMRIGETVEDVVQIVGGKARLLYRLQMKRVR